MKTLLVLILLAAVGCRDDGSPISVVQPPTIELAVVDIGTTDALLRIRFSGPPPQSFLLMRNMDTILTALTTSTDTLIADEMLEANQHYVFRAFRIEGSTVVDSSLSIQVQTTDSTSHAWQWAMDTLGISDSYLLDCAIISPNDVWVVGQIHLRDSLGNAEAVPHNAAHWDGSTWTPFRLKYNCRLYYANCGPETLLFQPATSVFAFGSDDVWIAAGSVHHFDGTQWTQEAAIPSDDIGGAGKATKIWGIDGQLWFVGPGGLIAHRDVDGFWQQHTSGAVQPLRDVIGMSSAELYAAAAHKGRYDIGTGMLLRNSGTEWITMIDGGNVDSAGLFRNSLYGSIEGVWVDERKTLYTAGNYVYRYRHGIWDYMPSLPGNCYRYPHYQHWAYFRSIRGNGSNDIFIFGDGNTLQHFNGVTWAEVGPPYDPLNQTLFWNKGDVKGDFAIAVGRDFRIPHRGVAIRFWR